MGGSRKEKEEVENQRGTTTSKVQPTTIGMGISMAPMNPTAIGML